MSSIVTRLRTLLSLLPVPCEPPPSVLVPTAFGKLFKEVEDRLLLLDDDESDVDMYPDDRPDERSALDRLCARVGEQPEFFLTQLAHLLQRDLPDIEAGRHPELLSWSVARLLAHVRPGRSPRLPAWMDDWQRRKVDLAANKSLASTRVYPYAAQIGLVSESRESGGASLHVSQAGRIFSELADGEGLLWLLLQECSRRGDPTLLSPTLARALLECQGDLSNLVRGSLAERLQDFAVLSKQSVRLPERAQRRSEGTMGSMLALTPSGRDLLADLVQRQDLPLAILASALRRDDTAAIVNRFLPPSVPPLASATDETIRLARHIIHEMRNALPPILPALEGVFRGMESSQHDALVKYRERIEKHIARALDNVDELDEIIQLSKGIVREPVDVLACLRDAIQRLNGDAADVVLAPSAGLPPLRAHRQGLVKALTEVLKNGVRATADLRQRRIEVGVGLTGQRIVITVDDNGPGVPSEHREAIFIAGFTTRSSGGQGLSLVRAELAALGGTITCSAAPLGGARFTITLPLVATTDPRAEAL